MQLKIDSSRCSAGATSLHEESGQPSYRSTNVYLGALNCQDTAKKLTSLSPAPTLLFHACHSCCGDTVRGAPGAPTLLLCNCLGDLEPFNRTGNVKYYMDINNSVTAGCKNIWFCTLPASLMALGEKQRANSPFLTTKKTLLAVSSVMLWSSQSAQEEDPCQL